MRKRPGRCYQPTKAKSSDDLPLSHGLYAGRPSAVRMRFATRTASPAREVTQRDRGRTTTMTALSPHRLGSRGFFVATLLARDFDANRLNVNSNMPARAGGKAGGRIEVSVVGLQRLQAALQNLQA